MSELEKFVRMLSELDAEFESHTVNENGEKCVKNISAEEVLEELLKTK